MDPLLNVACSNLLIATALAAVAWCVSRFCRRPQLAHMLWMLVMLKLVTPPFLNVPVPLTALLRESAEAEPADSNNVAAKSVSKRESTSSENVAPRVNDHASPRQLHTQNSPTLLEAGDEAGKLVATQNPTSTPSRILVRGEPSFWTREEIAMATWLVGAVMMLGRTFSLYLQMRKLLDQAHDADEELLNAATRLSQQMGLTIGIPVRIVDARVPPLVWGSFRPVILLPQDLLAPLSASQRDTVLVHELAHILRRDHWVRWLEMLVLVPQWWNPIAWWARRELRCAEEQCCDAYVVWYLPEGRRCYGRALLKTVEFLSASAPSVAAIGRTFGKPFFRRRIEMIVKQEIRPTMSRPGWAIATLMAILLPLGTQTHALDAQDSNPSDSIDLPQIAETYVPSAGSNDTEEARQREEAERERLAGSWRLVATSINGKPHRMDFEYYLWQFEARSLQTRSISKKYDSDKPVQMSLSRFVVNPDSSPKELTIYGNDLLIQTIYRWEKDDLLICFYGGGSKSRPDQFPDETQYREYSELPVMELRLVKDSTVDPTTQLGSEPGKMSSIPADNLPEEKEESTATLRNAAPVATSESPTADLPADTATELLELDVEEATVKLKAAKLELDHVQKLFNQKVVSDSEVERRNLEFELATIELKRAQVKLKQHQQGNRADFRRY